MPNKSRKGKESAMFPSSSPIPPSNDRDHASVMATGVFHIIQLSSSPQSARLQVEKYIRDEVFGIVRQTIADRDDDDAGGDQ
jgi:hypothetical protein